MDMEKLGAELLSGRQGGAIRDMANSPEAKKLGAAIDPAAAERAVAKAEERQYELTLKAEEVASNYLELQKVYDEQKALEEEIAALYTKWETLAAELEEARG